MRHIILAFSVIALLITSCNSSNKNNSDTQNKSDSLTTVNPPADSRQMTEVITRFVRAYVSKDNQKANKLIHPDLGLYVIYRPGAMDTYQHIDSIDFGNPVPNHYPYSDITNDYGLTFASLPVFDCGTEKWDKLGLIADTTKQANQLTFIAEFKNKFEEITDQQLIQIKEIEKDTYRIILTSEDPLIFHIKNYQGVWYIIALDRAYSGCDA